MKPLRLALALAALAATGVVAAAEERHGPPGHPRNSYANPSAVISVELAFARLAQDKGQWTAFAATAAPDAVMFTPQMVYARSWLHGRANPPVAVQWQPHQIWSSCDGSLMVSHGAWQRSHSTGYFTTLWQRQKDGSYKWILDSGDDLAQPLPSPEMIAAAIADCPTRSRRQGSKPDQPTSPQRADPKHPAPLDPAQRSGRSDDGSLRWSVTVDPSGARTLRIDWTKDGADKVALSETVKSG